MALKKTPDEVRALVREYMSPDEERVWYGLHQLPADADCAYEVEQAHPRRHSHVVLNAEADPETNLARATDFCLN
jgi:hypothetical protein